MKKITAVILAAVMLLALCACGGAVDTAKLDEITSALSGIEESLDRLAEQGIAAAETEAAEQETEPETSEDAIVVTDMTGREIILEEPATRVVALSAADCEVLFAVGAGDALVGRGEYCDWPVEVLDVPSVQSGYETNIEQIIALEPQVLLMSTMAQTEEQIAELENAGIRVVVSDAQDIDGVYEAVSMIGTLMGHEEDAEAVIADMRAQLDELAAEASGREGGTVYFEVSPLEYGLWAAGNGTFMNEIAELIGLENIFADVDGWGEVSEEQVIERDPDHIVTITMYFGEGPTPEEEIMSRPGWESISAVENGSILNLQNNELSRPVPRLAEGAAMLYDFVYGGAE